MDNREYSEDQYKKDNDTGNGIGPNYPRVKSSSYYREKTARKGIRPLHLVIVALISSILGGGVVFTAFQFVAPVIQPSMNSYFAKMVSNEPVESVTTTENSGYKKIEIEKTDNAVVAIAEKVSPSIVGIKAKAKIQDFFFGTRESEGEGSGIIITEDGYIMTNNHVIAPALDGQRGTKMLDGASIEVLLTGNKTYEARVVGRDYKTDLAVLKIEAKGLPAAELGDSDTLKPGELAVAIGNPGGLIGSVTSGIISGLDRTIEVDDKEFKLIQTDAAINPGNSGGALCNSEGKVVGVNTVKVAAVGYEGLGFAIPINDAREITDSLIEYKYVKGRPFLGIQADQRFTKDIADRYDVPEGVLVAEVLPLSGAYKAGMKPNDIITEFNGERIKNFAELEEQKNKYSPGDTVEIQVYRDDENVTLEVTLGEDKG